MTDERQEWPAAETRPHERLTVGDYVTLLLGVPVLSTVLAVELVRVWRGLNGGPLLITGLSDPEIAVRWSVSRLHFVAGLALHAVILLSVGAGLAYTFTLARRRWLQSKLR